MLNSPCISVIIPVYNAEKYLCECLDSIINQTLRDIEIICIDDGSTDNSLNILTEYASRDNRFIIISQKNSGVGIARNLCLQKVSGEYLVFVDPDDWISKNTAFQQMYDYAKQNDAEVVHFDNFEYIEYFNKIKKVNFGKRIKKHYNYNLLKSPYYSWRTFKNGCLRYLDWHVWAFVYNTKFIKENGIEFSQSRYGEDQLFTNSAILLAKRIYYLNDYLYYYRLRKGSLAHSKSYYSFDVFNNVNCMKEFIIKHNLWDELKTEFNKYKISTVIKSYNLTDPSLIKEYEKRCAEFLTPDELKEVLKRATRKRNFLENLFSIKNYKEDAVKYKLVTVFGIEFKLLKK